MRSWAYPGRLVCFVWLCYLLLVLSTTARSSAVLLHDNPSLETKTETSPRLHHLEKIQWGSTSLAEAFRTGHLPEVREEGEGQDWTSVDRALEAGVADGAFPGCVAIVGDAKGALYVKTFGHYTYGAIPPRNRDNPHMSTSTLFDMAICTKVTATTSAVAQFYQRGELALDQKVTEFLGPEYATHGKGPITVLNLLLHNSGYPPDPYPNYWDPRFGCPETKKYHPEENFSCQAKIYEGLLHQTLQNPIGAKYVYSDLSFITLMYIVGTLARDLKYITPAELVPGCDQGGPAVTQCYYEAYVRKYVFTPLGMQNTMFLPPTALWSRAAPCENDTQYLHRVIQGQVSDGNAYALGGIAGHAGLFSTAPDIFILMHRLMFATPNDSFLNKTTVSYFTREYNHSQSSRALGWNTNDPNAFDYGWNQSCGDLSPRTWMHLGYTGTEMCGDPDRQIFTILLTNRVYPTAANTKIHKYRVAFNSAVRRVVDAKRQQQEQLQHQS